MKKILILSVLLFAVVMASMVLIWALHRKSQEDDHDDIWG